jgi:hypothetical protein
MPETMAADLALCLSDSLARNDVARSLTPGFAL